MTSFRFNVAKVRKERGDFNFEDGSAIGGTIKVLVLMQNSAVSTADLDKDYDTVHDCIGAGSLGRAIGYYEFDGAGATPYNAGAGNRYALGAMTVAENSTLNTAELTPAGTISMGSPNAGTYNIRGLLVFHENAGTAADNNADSFPIDFIDGGNLNTGLNGTGQAMTVSWSGIYGSTVDV